MDNKELLQLKNQLEKKKKDLEKRLKKFQKVPEFGSDVDSFDEETDESEEFANQLAVAQDFKNHLADIELTLKKIKENRYGGCEKCKKEISLDILNIVPESRLCQKCKRVITN